MNLRDLELLAVDIRHNYIEYCEDGDKVEILFETTLNVEDFSDLNKVEFINRCDDTIYVYLTKEDK